jgi:hypothetical protein
MNAVDRYDLALTLWASAYTQAFFHFIPIVQGIKDGTFDPSGCFSRDGEALRAACKWATMAANLQMLRKSLCDSLSTDEFVRYNVHTHQRSNVERKRPSM